MGSAVRKKKADISKETCEEKKSLIEEAESLGERTGSRSYREYGERPDSGMLGPFTSGPERARFLGGMTRKDRNLESNWFRSKPKWPLHETSKKSSVGGGKKNKANVLVGKKNLTGIPKRRPKTSYCVQRESGAKKTYPVEGRKQFTRNWPKTQLGREKATRNKKEKKKNELY